MVHEFGVNGAEELLGFDDENDQDDNEEDFGEDITENLNFDLYSPQKFNQFQADVRLKAAKRAEGNRRAGGLKTQQAVVRNWKVMPVHF